MNSAVIELFGVHTKKLGQCRSWKPFFTLTVVWDNDDRPSVFQLQPVVAAAVDRLRYLPYVPAEF